MDDLPEPADVLFSVAMLAEVAQVMIDELMKPNRRIRLCFTVFTIYCQGRIVPIEHKRVKPLVRAYGTNERIRPP